MRSERDTRDEELKFLAVLCIIFGIWILAGVFLP